MTLQKRAGGSGGLHPPPSANKMMCITLPYSKLGGPQKEKGVFGEAHPRLLANKMMRILAPDCKHSHGTVLMMETDESR